MGQLSAPASAGRQTLGVGIAALVLFLVTWTDAVQIADSGEMIAAACNGGVAHPPGYPLFTWIGGLLCWLPISTPAGRVGLVSVLAGAGTIALLHALIFRLTAARWAAAIASLGLASSAVFWRHASGAEVFALNAFICVLLVHASLRTAEAPATNRLWPTLTGFTMGLVVCHHHPAVFVFPIAIAALCNPRPNARAVGRRILWAGMGCAVGLLPLLHFFMARPDAVPRWGQPNTIGGLLDHLLRRDYGTLSLAQSGGQRATLANLWFFVTSLPEMLPWLFLPLAAAGLGLLMIRGVTGRNDLRGSTSENTTPLRRDLAVVLALLPLTTGPLFLGLLNLAPSGIAAQETHRYLVLPAVLLALCAGVGLAALEHRAFDAPAFGVRRRRMWQGVGWIAVAFTALTSYGRANQRDNHVVQNHILNGLEAAAPGALILGTGDAHLFGYLYAQTSLGLRPDVQYIDVRMLLYDWYARQKQRERPELSYRFTPGKVDSITLVANEMKRGVPVYLAQIYNQRIVQTYRGYPEGPLFRLIPGDQPVPAPGALLHKNLTLAARLHREGVLPDPIEAPWEASLQVIHAENWRALAGGLARSGDDAGAQRAMAEAAALAPWLFAPKSE